MDSITNKHVAVVGGAGFLGSHMCYALKKRNCHVRVIDNLCVGNVKFLPEVELIAKDISHDSLDGVFEGIDYVFNYAALPFIPDCFDDPLSFVYANIVGALRVCEEAAKQGVQRILQVSSAEVYGNCPNRTSLAEDDQLGPPSTYATTKAAIDNLCVARFKERQIPVIVLRQFNCVGERETHRYVVPEIIEQIYHTKAEDNGDVHIKLGEDTERDFLYAGDAVAMAIELLEKGQLGEVYNMGSERATHIYDLAQMINKIMRPDNRLIIDYDETRKRPAEIYCLLSHNGKLYETIDRRPRVSLKDALHKTIKYFCQNGFKWDFNELHPTSRAS